jgi:hypothetical protein
MSKTVPFTTLELARKPCAEEAGGERRSRKGSGIWRCELATLAPLCIQSSFARLSDADAAVIPASSLRGMVRNMAEMLGAGCGRFHADAEWLPDRLKPCSEHDACLVCRVFGFVDGDYALAGKVRFVDAVLHRPRWEKYAIPSTQRDPHDTLPGGGWILFPRKAPASLAHGPMRCLAAGQRIVFRVEYLNLDEEEYAVFKYALTLEHDGVRLCHMLGYAKALGLGACIISVLVDKSDPPGPVIGKYLTQPAHQALKNWRALP